VSLPGEVVHICIGREEWDAIVRDIGIIAWEQWMDHEKFRHFLWRWSANGVSSIAVPCLIVASVNAKIRWDAHWEHVAHDTPKEDKPEYAYQNLRTKNYFWGDGDKV
jgi:hypothetical protein